MSYAIVTYKTTEGVYVALTKSSPTDYAIAAFETIQQGCDHFTQLYDRWHSRSAEASVSAILHFIQLQPKVHAMPSIEFIAELLGPDPHVLILNGVSHSGTVVAELHGPAALAFHESGITPELVTDAAANDEEIWS